MIGLVNFYSTRNLGDCAIYAALAKMSPEGRVYAKRADAEPTLVPGLEYASDLERCTSFISVGGDIFNNGRPRLVARRFLKNVEEIRNRAERTIVFGQSIPPSCRGFARRYLASSMRKLAAVCVRDVESHDSLAELRTRSLLSFDTAFVLSPTVTAEQAAAALYDQNGLDPARTIVLSIREHNALYAGDRAAHEATLASLLSVLARRGHQVAVVIQADHDAADTDWSLALRLKASLPALQILDPFAAPPPLPPHELFAGILSIAKAVAAVRYHGAVLRLTAGKQAYVMHYSNKGADLCRRLGLPGGRAGEMGAEEMARGIEASANGAFDAKPLAAHVRESFNACMGTLQ